MPRKDFEIFIDLCKSELDEKYYCQHNLNDNSYWHPFAKIRKNGTIFEEAVAVNSSSHKGIYVDIFPLDNASKQTSFFQTCQAKLSKSLTAIIMQRHNLDVTNKISKKTGVLLFLTRCLSVRSLIKFQNSIMRLNKNDSSIFFVNLGSQYNFVKQTIEKERFLPSVEAEFEGKLYMAPKDYDYFLTRIYGNYMELPPEEKRVNHNPVRIVF
jgi:lipopolysaccharide cholinephosphotransferase